MQEQLADVWTNGTYETVASAYYSMAGRLVERTAVGSDDEVLDIGCGTGSVAITAARRGARVTGIDVAPAMLDHARTNANIADFGGIEWQEGNAVNLPFEADAFDVTLSSLGHMYGDPPEETTAELLRVTRPDGTIGFTSWTPTSLYPFMASILTTYLAPEDLPEFTEPPFAWGDSGVVRERLGGELGQLSFETGTVLFPALSPEHFWRETTETSGPIIELLDAVPAEKRPALDEEMVETIRPYFDEEQNGVELEYLLTTAKR